MTRAASWTNADSLIVGFGPNTTHKNVGGVVNTLGAVKEARMEIDFNSITTASPFGIVLPAESLLLKCWCEVGTAWATADAGKIEFGVIGGDVDALIDDLDEQVATGGTANSKFAGDGPDVVGSTSDNQGIPFSYAAETRLGITKANTFTAGTAVLVVQYI